MPAPPPSFPLRVGCVDIGSNAIRGLMAEFSDPDHAKVLLQERVSLRLGHTVFLHGAIARDDMAAAVAALAKLHAQMAALGVQHVRAVATSAVREASNAEAFVKQVRAGAGLDLEVISGAEEARLVLAAIRHKISFEGRPWLFMDLGGGSLELGLADARGLLWSETHALGTVRLLEEFAAVASDPERADRLIEQTVDALAIPVFRGRRKPQGLIAIGGNIEELTKLAGPGRDAQGTPSITIDELEQLTRKLAAMTVQQRISELGLRPDRADVILPAAFVYARVARAAGIDRIQVPRVGLKDGVLYDLVDSLTVHTDPSERRATQLIDDCIVVGHRYQFEESHALQVQRLALSLFDQLRDLHGLGPDDRRLLAGAAVLHDVGRFIDDRRHHKHSYYLIREADVPRLDKESQEVIAIVARYHRKKEPSMAHGPFSRLSAPNRDRVTRLAALLRVADALDREHADAVQAVTVRRENKAAKLLLHGNGNFELESWAVRKKGALFTRIFGLELSVEAA